MSDHSRSTGKDRPSCIEHTEEVGFAVPALVLRQAGLKRLGEVTPETVEPHIHHLKHAAAIRRLVAVEVKLGLRRVGIARVGQALQHAKRNEGIEKIAGTALVEPEGLAQLDKPERPLDRKLCEQPELDRTQKRLRAPKGAAEL